MSTYVLDLNPDVSHIVGDCDCGRCMALLAVETGDRWYSISPDHELFRFRGFIADAQGGDFFPCDGGCGREMFGSYEAQDRDYDRFHNGAFYCAACEQKELDDSCECPFRCWVHPFDDDPVEF